MSGVYDTLYNWARKTSASFAELRFVTSQEDGVADDGNDLIYRLKHWPVLSTGDRTANVFRALSVMSNRPVNRPWMLANLKMRAEQVDQLLGRLIQQGAVEVIDRSKFPSAGAA